MSDNLRSAKAKLARANLHKGTAKREAVRFFDRHAGPTFDIEPEGDAGLSADVRAINVCRLVVKTAPPDLPDSFAARFGDAIHNYRCVLDHIAWELVRHGSRWPLSEKEGTRVQFPIYRTEADFDANWNSRLPGVVADAVAFVKARHEYAGGNATNEALLGLASLSNEDKHRALHFFLSIFKSLESEVTFNRCRPLTWNDPITRPHLKAGAVVAHFSYVVTGPHPEVKMQITPEAQIVIEDGRDFSEMLEGLHSEVTHILNAPEILAAVT